MALIPDKQGNQHRSYDDICTYLTGCHPIEHFSIIDNVHQHQQSGRYNKHLTNMQVGQGNGFNGAVMTETDDNKQDSYQNQYHHKVIHIFPVIMICQQSGYQHRSLSPTVH